MSESKSDKKGYFQLGKHWPIVIVLMLVFHASIILGTIAIVNARHDLYVDENYYAKSVDWDHQREMMDAPQVMGWSIDVSAAKADTQVDSEYLVHVELRDRNDDPMDNALVELNWYHPAHASERVSLVLVGDGDGHYQGSVEMTTPGFWQAQLRMRYQGVEAMVSREIEIEIEIR